MLEQSRTKSNQYLLKVLETNFIRDKIQNDFLTLKNRYKFHLFHMTVTWIKTPIPGDISSLNNDFLRFYTRNLVPDLLQERRINSKNRIFQPIAISFIEDGDAKNKNLMHPGNCQSLHHHCLLAARGKSAARLLALSGVNTLKPYFLKKQKNPCNAYQFICTSDLKEISNPDVQLRYASKSLWQFREETMLRFNYPIDYEKLNTH